MLFCIRFIAKVLTVFTAALFFAAALPTAAAEKSTPAMWRLKDDDSVVYLFGTLHFLPAEIAWMTPALEEAMNLTGTTMVEADVVSPEAQATMVSLVQKHGLNPPGVTLSSILGESQAAELGRVAGGIGIPLDALEPYRPWFALLNLSVAALQKEGFNPQSGVESQILKRAIAEGDKFAYLETVEYQIKVFASLDEVLTPAYFDMTIAEFDDLSSDLDLMLEAWLNGDEEAINCATLAEMREASPDAFETLFTTRNKNWAERIADIMEGEGEYFIAVGVGHLVGEDSVVSLLEKKGYEVERVQ